MTEREENSQRKSAKSRRSIKCPVCGRTICACSEGCDIYIVCPGCKTPLTVSTYRNRLAVCETELAYEA